MNNNNNNNNDADDIAQVTQAQKSNNNPKYSISPERNSKMGRKIENNNKPSKSTAVLFYAIRHASPQNSW